MLYRSKRETLTQFHAQSSLVFSSRLHRFNRKRTKMVRRSKPKLLFFLFSFFKVLVHFGFFSLATEEDSKKYKTVLIPKQQQLSLFFSSLRKERKKSAACNCERVYYDRTNTHTHARSLTYRPLRGDEEEKRRASHGSWWW